ncbi:MAG: DUF6390 family protein [Acidimicrobiales bacterium]
MEPGPVLFARYAYPPNALGYCGPADPDGLLGAVDQGDLEELSQRAASFTGAWPYLRAIAGANGIADPLDRRVVDAYWVGNPMLDAVGEEDLAGAAAAAAGSPADPAWAAAGTGGALAHHSFHVFAVYPWLRLLRAGREEPALTVLDRCRIRWGTVDAVATDTVRVRCAPLCVRQGRLVLGPQRTEEVRFGVGGIDGVGLVQGLAPGDTVSMHWDWVCERLDATRASTLQSCTLHNLAVVNDA